MDKLIAQLKLSSLELALKPGLFHPNHYIYFVLSVSSPDAGGQMAVVVLPKDNTLEWGKHQTSYSFVPNGDPNGGLILLSMPIPPSKSINAKLWVMRSEKGLQEIGNILSGIAGFIDNKVEGSQILQIAGHLNPIFMSGFSTITNGLEQLGEVLSKTGDKQIGFVSMDQVFDTDPGGLPTPITCKQEMMSGQGGVVWNWLCLVPTAIS